MIIAAELRAVGTLKMNSNKWFTIIKVGYSAGIYGCSGEYFTCIYFDGNAPKSIHFSGMYGAEERVSRLLQDAGYTAIYTQSFFGRMTRKDTTKNMLSEYTAIEELKNIINK